MPTINIAEIEHLTKTDTVAVAAVSEYLPDVKNLFAVFPVPWAGDPAYNSTGTLFALASVYAYSIAKLRAATTYTNAQKRISTAFGDNLDAISNDIFGPNVFPRRYVVAGLNIVREADGSFRTRILAAIVAPNNTLVAIQNAVASYLVTGYAADVAANVQTIGLDATGGLDSRGALDGVSSTVPVIPSVLVYDLQSNPVLSARSNLQPGQFVVGFYYGGLTFSGLFLDYSRLDYSYMILPASKIITPPIGVSKLVNSVKATGMQPVYVDNRTT